VDWVGILALAAAAQLIGTWLVLAVLSINREEKD
jgi:hypothetical protein